MSSCSCNSNWVFEFPHPLFCIRFWVPQICISLYLISNEFGILYWFLQFSVIPNKNHYGFDFYNDVIQNSTNFVCFLARGQNYLSSKSRFFSLFLSRF
jgi:hypothetical protein